MSQKPERREARGLLAEIRSFVFTLVVVTFGIAFVAAMLTGGPAGAEGLIGNLVRWLLDFGQNVLETLRGYADGAGR